MQAEREIIGRGMRSEIIAWGPGKVLKLYYPGHSAAFVEGEAKATRRAAELGIPAPAVYQTLELDGRHGIVMDRLEGPTLEGMILRRPFSAPRLAVHLARLQAIMHRIDVSAEARPLTVQLRSRITHPRSPLSEEQKAVAVGVLDTMPTGKSLCHGDLHPQNVIMTKGRGPVVIDWDAPTSGNPLADVARTFLILRAGSYHAPKEIRQLISLITRAAGRNYLRGYLELAGDLVKGAGDFGTWLWLNAAARLVEGVEPEEQWLFGIVRRGIERDRQQSKG